jgi:hypothetical protein
VIQRAECNAGHVGAAAVCVGAAQRIAKADLLFEVVNDQVVVRLRAEGSHLADESAPGRDPFLEDENLDPPILTPTTR